jgi:hypothetical protein
LEASLIQESTPCRGLYTPPSPALVLVLTANPQHAIEQLAEAVFQHCGALDLAPNVTDDAAEPGA